MCGIVGIVGPGARHPATLSAMTDTLVHRGPDSRGSWVSSASPVAFGHTRLAVVGLGDQGAQPMSSPSGRYVMTYNGEIYNHQALRKQLGSAGSKWQGGSDTETLVHAFDQWGIAATVDRLVGMFAFGVWDRQAHELVLARDRMGEKPLHVGMVGRDLAFASELRAFRGHHEFVGNIHREALEGLLRLGVVPSPTTIYQEISRVEPGTLVRYRLGDLANPLTTRYWSVASVAGRTATFTGSTDDAVDALDAALTTSVAGQRIADVPIGAFLSGGVDSSLIVALLQETGTTAKTFTIGFESTDHDESAYAEAVAHHLGTDHTTFRVTDQDVRDAIVDLPGMTDAPFADPSQLPTLLLSRLTRGSVTVALTGDAGDELFGGYDRYRVADLVERVPAPLRRAAKSARAVPVGALDIATRPLQALQGRNAQPGSHKWRLSGARIHDLGRILPARSEHERYSALLDSDAAAHPNLVAGERAPCADAITSRRAEWWGAGSDLDPWSRRMLYDTGTYLVDDILAKVDAAAMAVSLETRIPMLDHRFVELAWSLPMHMKVRDGSSKWPLRAMIERRVPRALIERPKAGFGVPLGGWLRGSLAEWAGDLVSVEAIRSHALIDPRPVQRWWREHQRGHADRARELWPVIVFNQWFTSTHAKRA